MVTEGQGDRDRRQRLERIVRRAAGLRAEARDAFLGEACGGDDELRAEAESLLISAAAADVAPTGDAPADSQDPVPPTSMPTEVGGFRITRKIGEGGMGIVYRAVQSSPRRTVALKVIRPHMLSPQAVRRFRFEAETLGRLQHPAIAQLYQMGVADVGEGEQPYFAMEFIKGRSLLAHADAAQLNVRKRLALMLRIIDAVQFAHSKGIVHRDLKPANILVTEDGQPKILDFGVARATGHDVHVTTVMTDVNELVGTLPYMSPEQVSGDPESVDARSDVYALGVILYELLAGRLPYDLRRYAVYEAVRIIREQEPSSLSEIDRTFRGDIETIVGKALEKVPERRYASASELGSDIDRFLNDEPISARPPSAVYKISKFARRHRAAAAVIAAAAAGLAVAAVGAGYGYLAATRSAAQEREARALAETNREAAEHRLAQLEKVTGIVGTFGEKIERRSGGTLARRVFAETVSEALGEVLAETAGDPVLQRRVAEASLAAGRLAIEAGSTEQAGASFGIAEELAGELLISEGDRPGLRLVRGDAMVGQAMVLARTGDQSGALAMLSDARDQIAAAGDGLEADRLRATVEMERSRLLALTDGRIADAEPTMRRAAELWLTVAGHAEAGPEDHERLAMSRVALADWLGRREQLDRAAETATQCLEAIDAALGRWPEDQGLRLASAEAWGALARIEHRRLDADGPDGAERAYLARHAVLEPLHYEDPWNDRIYQRLASSFQEFGDFLVQAGRPDEARRWLETYRDAARRALAADPTNLERRRAVAIASRALAELVQQSDPAAAIEAADTAIAAYTDMIRAAPENVDLVVDLGLVEFVKTVALFMLHRAAPDDEQPGLERRILESAEPAARRLLALHESGSLTPDRVPYVARALRNAARYVATAGDPARALAWFLTADELEPRLEWRLRRDRARIAAMAAETDRAASDLLEAYRLLADEPAESRDAAEANLRRYFDQMGVAWPGSASENTP